MRNHSGFVARGLSLALLTLLSASPHAGQQSTVTTPPPGGDPAQAQPPRFRTEANYVRVDAYPMKDGKPVQDLTAEDFELFENDSRQKIQAFEHVVISPAGPQSLRAEAASVRGAEQQAANPRNRVFVIYLDIPHVAVEGSHHIKEPLIRLIDRILGPDDLVAVMTPEMSAQQVTFGRKTEVIADMLRDRWTWGMRHRLVPMDDRETEYQRCYPAQAQEGLVAEMIARRRERIVLDSLRDLVTYLGGVREERKAIITISEGWTLFRPNQGLLKLRTLAPGLTEPVPGNDPVGVDEFGKLRTGATRSREGNTALAGQSECDRERMHLANIDDEQYFRQILDQANRLNSSFYPVDPRGLAVFDFPIGPGQPPSLQVDRASLTQRIETLRTLASATDGVAVVNSNDLDGGLRRIADDLTSYYLLGYYSSNTKLDGGFRKITVRVKRPGVDVRARRGYRAATLEEVNASRAAAAAPVPEATRTANAAMASLDRARDDQRFAVRGLAVRENGSGPVRSIWVAGELIGSLQAFGNGANGTVELSGTQVDPVTVTLGTGERAFLVKLPVSGDAEAIGVRARLKSIAGGEQLSDSVQVTPSGPGTLLFRRGPLTGNRLQPAGDVRFSRTERLHVEAQLPPDAVPGAGRLLDRKAQPLQVPVQVAERKDEDGRRWLTADATLAPLAAGDYVVEVAYAIGATEQKVLTAFRVTK